MNVEFEATFANINKDQIRQKLGHVGAELIRPEFMQKRVVFNLPKGHEIEGGWLRVRDEGDKVTMSLKAMSGDGIERQKELEMTVSDFETGVKLLKAIGCEEKAFQESYRELWRLGDVEITIDEWPFLEPFVEIESDSQEKVKKVAEQMGFDYSEALFDSVDGQYSGKYEISAEAVNQRTPKIIFNMENPFVNRND